MPAADTPANRPIEMSDVLAERVAMHARERSDISLQEARDVPSLVEAAYAINNDQGLPASIVEVSQFNQPNCQRGRRPDRGDALPTQTGEEHAGHHLFSDRHLGDPARCR